mgnify:CR=1 FL=1|jgi:hypothetical protein
MLVIESKTRVAAAVNFDLDGDCLAMCNNLGEFRRTSEEGKVAMSILAEHQCVSLPAITCNDPKTRVNRENKQARKMRSRLKRKALV